MLAAPSDAADPVEGNAAMKAPVYYARKLCSSAERQQAAHTLLMALLVRKIMEGTQQSFWENKWGRRPMSLYTSVAKMRSLLAARRSGVRDLSSTIPDPVPLKELRENPDIYGPLLDDIEIEACMTLDDDEGRAEAVIRQMFDKEPRALFFLRAERPKPRDPKRKPGRPKGSKNKPKADQTEEGWLMPDGLRIKL